ncbi:MAG: TRAP transporter substrate-binding protein [Rhodospirillales bacterium]|jgi:tripartite ATP-independent transporter DctP family solute receptor|nr:TRAP transporter substrate-binding protein [Rhodospirillales bacterium]
MKKLLTPTIAAAVVLGTMSSVSAMEIKSSDVHPMGYPTTEGIKYLGEKLGDWTNGRLSIKIFHSMQLGGEKEALEQVQIGALEMTRVSVGVVGPIVKEFDAFNLPYFFRDVNHMHKVTAGEIGQDLLNRLEGGGLIGLGYMDAGSRSFYNKVRPINKPADLKGLKIRVMQNPVFVELVNSLGGNGIQVSFSELYTALQTGVVDGAENNPPTLYNHKHYEIANHYSLTHHLIVPEIFVFSKKVWDTMSPLDQQLIRKASALTVEKVRDLWAKKEAGDFANLAKVGVKVNEVANKAPFIKATQVVRDNFAKKGDSFKKIIAAVAAVK